MITIRYSIVAMLLNITTLLYAQFPPAEGQPGSTAMYKDSAAFIAWATGCTVTRGPMDISQPANGLVTYGTESAVKGIADNAVISLGDGGSATLTFDVPIANGTGYDFAVFENSFSDSFLELAFVEVSSDGVNFTRFNSVSLTPADTQVGGFGTLNPALINNLAGKYRGGYGVPFDLEELKGVVGLNVNHITHIRITDVIGCVSDSFATHDSQGRKINDPWPTPFPTGGFDLDAVGVINNITNTSVPATSAQQSADLVVFPNPFCERVNLIFRAEKPGTIEISDVYGRAVYSGIAMNAIDLSFLEPGVYMLTLSINGKKVIKKIERI